MFLADQTDCFTRLFYLTCFRTGRLFHAWATTPFFYAVTETVPCQDDVIFSYSRIPWFDTLWLSIVTQKKCTFPLTVFSTYTIEEIWQLTHGVQQRCCPLYQWQRNTTQSHMECTCHSQLFRRYRCAQEHPCFYTLTTLFPSISPYKRIHTCVDNQNSNSNNNHNFSPTHFHAVKQPIPWVLSDLIMMTLTRIHTPSLLLCLFILTHCLNPHHGDNKTGVNIDQSVLVCSHTFNVHSSTPHSLLWC